MTPAENLATVADSGAGSPEEPAPEAGPFVINLCSSSTPMALPRTDLPELQRFNFFVSRRFEEGRERFRLHMGFFETLAEAEGWLTLVREMYPGAWAGEAPGKKLRARAAAAAAAQAAHASGPHAAAPAPGQPPESPAGLPADVAARVPTLHPAEARREAVSHSVHSPDTGSATAPADVEPETVEVLSLNSSENAPRGAAAGRSGHPTGRPAAAQGVPLANSNIKEVLAALDEPAVDRGRSAPADTRTMPAPALAAVPATLSDRQALQLLEGRAQEGARPAAFAVQLQWSVQPILLDKVPPLAIFGAYTLYCIEGSREGRKWFGLRLGFFNDPISAKQVAGYVRSEFASVAVVPVSAEERKQVSGDKVSMPMPSPPRKAQGVSTLESGEFKLFDSDHPTAGGAGPADPPPHSAAVHQLHPIGAVRAVKGGKINAHERRAPQTLEETLEILGAHQLSIDEGRNGRGGSGPPRRNDRSTPFTRLLERLGERVRKS